VRLKASKPFELFNPHRECEVHTDSFTPGSPGSYWEPPDGPEWSPKPFVDVTFYNEDGQKVHEDVVTWDTFIIDYAVEHGLTLAKADEAVEAAMIEEAFEHLEEAYDDSRERAYYGDD
jgi:hypothetical protein